MAESQKNETLSKAINGVPTPLIPKQASNEPRVEKWRRDLIDWINRKFNRLTGQNIITTIIEAGGDTIFGGDGGDDGVLGFGPVKIEVYTDYEYVDGTTPFGGTKIGEMRDVTISSTGDYSIRQGFGPSSTPPNVFLARWTVNVVPDFSEDYEFSIQYDDAARIYIDDVLVFDDWDSAGHTENLGPYSFTADTPVKIKIEVINLGATFALQVLWKSTSQTAGSFEPVAWANLQEVT